VFGPNDIYLSAFEFSQRLDWSGLSLSELTKLYAVFSRTITISHPHGHAAFGRAFLGKGALDRAITALQTAVEQAGDSAPEHLLSLIRAQFQAGQYDRALSTLQRYVPLAAPADRAMTEELDSTLQKLVVGQKHALLIGIDEYLSSKAPRLKGAQNDVVAIKQLLMQRWGFQAEHIVELVNNQATRTEILTEFERLVDFARREPAFLFFSGLGSLEQSGRPTIVPYDARQADVCDILLEKLADLVDDANAKLVTVLDTGFWGSRSGAGDRTIEPDDRGLTDSAGFASYDEWSTYLDGLQIGAMTIFPRVKPL
jgi:tetratricopeptide (TPR) repeat protein